MKLIFIISRSFAFTFSSPSPSSFVEFYWMGNVYLFCGNIAFALYFPSIAENILKTYVRAWLGWLLARCPNQSSYIHARTMPKTHIIHFNWCHYLRVSSGRNKLETQQLSWWSCVRWCGVVLLSAQGGEAGVNMRSIMPHDRRLSSITEITTQMEWSFFFSLSVDILDSIGTWSSIKVTNRSFDWRRTSESLTIAVLSGKAVSFIEYIYISITWCLKIKISLVYNVRNICVRSLFGIISDELPIYWLAM